MPALAAKVLTVSDGVAEGSREDRSGAALVARLTEAGFTVADHRVVPDGVASGGGNAEGAATAAAVGAGAFTANARPHSLQNRWPSMARAPHRSHTMRAQS